MAKQFYNFSPGRVTASFKGVEIRGFMTGTMIEAELTTDTFAKDVGATGDAVRIQSEDTSGMVTFTLMSSSAANDELNAIANSDRKFGDGVGALLVKDLNGTTVLQADNAWIRRKPNLEISTDATSREWVMDCADLNVDVGGNTR